MIAVCTMQDGAPVTNNPFIAGIYSCFDLRSLPDRLSSIPEAANLSPTCSMEHRIFALTKATDEFYEPTDRALRFAEEFFQLLVRGYVPRNPVFPLVRREDCRIALLNSNKESCLAWFPTYASGMSLVGITGLGKTWDVRSVLKATPQFVDHGNNPEAGWECFRQVVWLYVGLSFDGSLGGFLVSILSALDEAAGTHYSTTPGVPGMTVDKLAVYVAIKLRCHAVGAVVVDELQKFRRRSGADQPAWLRFLLRVLNFGIPIVLIGTTASMEETDGFAQDMRRFSSGGRFEYDPYEQTSLDWCDGLVPALMAINAMPERNEEESWLPALLWKFCGGISDYAVRMRIESQIHALRLGAIKLTPEHLAAVYVGPKFSSADRNLIEGFRDKDPFRLAAFMDIPWQTYARKWGYLTDKSTEPEPNVGDALPAANPDRQGTRSAAGAKAFQTRRKNAEQEQRRLRETLSEDDLRKKAEKDFMVESLRALTEHNAANAGKRGSKGQAG